MRIIFTFLICFSTYAFDHDHMKWDGILKKYTTQKNNQTLFNYKSLKKMSVILVDYLNVLSEVKKEEYDQFNESQKLAFLINAYNAFTVKLIIDNYPVKTIKYIKEGGLFSVFSSPWKIVFIPLLGKKMTLDEIEHDIIRKKFNEPRIHFAVNCASISCPNLLQESFKASILEEQLENAALSFLKDKNKNKFKNGILYLSSIFKWYGEDFENKYESVEGFVTRKLNIQESIKKTKYLDYDWNLNEWKK